LSLLTALLPIARLPPARAPPGERPRPGRALLLDLLRGLLNLLKRLR
jgi:hypothetical protein